MQISSEGMSESLIDVESTIELQPRGVL